MDGIIIINKPKNCTSHSIVQKAKKIFNKKVGHTGTLDPMATGVLPLLIGKGTLCSSYLINHDKIYEVQLTLGIKTDTADSEGTILETKNVPEEIFKPERISEILDSFIGKQQQIPPIYSAIKVNGKKLYEYARRGQTVEIQPRQIEIYEIKLQKINKEQKQIEFKVHCSKGTYIRSLCEDIAKKMNTIGYMSALNRIQVGKFNIEDSISIETLEENIENEEFMKNKFITLENVFQDNNSIELNNKKLELFLNGVKLTYKTPDGIYKIYHDKSFIGTGIVKEELLKRNIII
jgi:tRNA pseudouridine55 synthase